MIARTLFLLLSTSAHLALSHFPTSSTRAILVSSSRYWFNYRHTSNALTYYRVLRRLGVRDDAIALFLPEDHGCDARNAALHRGTIHALEGGPGSPFGEGLVPGGGRCAAPAEVDFGGAEASAESLLRLLGGRAPTGAPPPFAGGGFLPRGGGRGVALLLVLTGHGGDGYLKFHDRDELSYADLAGALADAYAAGRFGTLLVVADTCQAASVAGALRGAGLPPGAAAVVASSAVGENSYSAGLDDTLAVPLVDAFSRSAGAALERAVAGESAAAAATVAAAAGGGRASLGELCGARGGGGAEGNALVDACAEVAAAAGVGAQRAVLGWADGAAALREAAALRWGAGGGPRAPLWDLAVPSGHAFSSTVTVTEGSGTGSAEAAAAVAGRPLLPFFLGGADVEVR